FLLPLLRPPPRPTLFPYTTLFRSQTADTNSDQPQRPRHQFFLRQKKTTEPINVPRFGDWFLDRDLPRARGEIAVTDFDLHSLRGDRKSTRLNSSHLGISYAVFCLK